MFKLYTYNALFSNSKLNSIKIIDTDFQETIEIELSPHGIVSAVIECYESKNLNIAYNLLLLLQFRAKIYQYPIEREMSYSLKNVEKYKKYHNEVQKLLLLI